MDDVLPPVDLDRRPVALHGGDLAAGDSRPAPFRWSSERVA
jgi:hypothetical protein